MQSTMPPATVARLRVKSQDETGHSQDMPARYILCTLSDNDRRVFCFFCIDTSVPLSGLSMPTKISVEVRLPHQRQQDVVVGDVD